MRSALLAGAAIALALASPALAVQQPVPGRADDRIAYVNYDPSNVTRIWSTPGAVAIIEFAEGETIDSVAGADACPAGNKDKECGLEPAPRGNFLFLKFRHCLIPEPVLVLTKTAAGSLRRYAFEVKTEPEICPDTTQVSPPPPSREASLFSRANATEAPVGAGNLKYITQDALTDRAKTPVHYSVVFRYPGDEAAKRRETARETARERRARQQKEEITQALSREVDFATKDPFSGNRNYRYAARGDGNLQPRWIWDNGYLTAIVYPGLQRMPAVFRVEPDGKEATANFTVRGDTIIMTGTAQVIRVRDGSTVMEFYNLGYSPSGATPGTGTASPAVERVLKGAGDEH